MCNWSESPRIDRGAASIACSRDVDIFSRRRLVVSDRTIDDRDWAQSQVAKLLRGAATGSTPAATKQERLLNRSS